MPEWFSGDVDANGVRIHYHRTGGDRPPLVLSHGATDSGLCWTPVARALESEYDVIMPDARGHGLSDAPANGYSSAEQAADLAALITTLGLERPAVGGHSMGAGTTLQLIADHPQLARCAILEDPGFRSGGPPQPGARDAMRRVVRDAQSDGLEATIARGRVASPRWSEDELGPWAQAKVQLSRQFLDELGNRTMGPEWSALLPRVRCPVLLIIADLELGSIVTRAVAEEARQLSLSLQVVHLGGAGHNIRRERFDRFVVAVQTFLATAGTPAQPAVQHGAS